MLVGRRAETEAINRLLADLRARHRAEYPRPAGEMS
jgi:hypothetical protein